MASMARRVFLLLTLGAFVLAVAGCGGSSPYTGAWETDVEATKATFRAAMEKHIETMKASEDESERMAAGMMQGMLGSMIESMAESMKADMTINADGTYAVTDANDVKTEGTWESEGGQIIMYEGEAERARGSIEGGKLVILPRIEEDEDFPVDELRIIFVKAG